MSKILNLDPTFLTIDDFKTLKDKPDFKAYMHTLSTGSTGIADRTGTFKFPISFKIINLLEKLQESDVTYSECCDIAATDLLKKLTGDNKLYIMYSGGIDSTCILAALLKNSSPQQQQDFVIILSKESIAENKNFFFKFIAGNLNYISSTRLKYLNLNDNDIVTHGESNDQFYDTSEHLSYAYRKNKLISVDVNLISRMLLNYRNPTDSYNLEISEIYKYILDYSAKAVGLELTCIADYHQWQMLNFIYTYTISRPNLLFPNLSKNFQPFYNCRYFNIWTMNKIANKNYDTKGFFKKETRDYIFEFDKNEYYYQFKNKVGSGPRLTVFESPAFILNDCNEKVEPSVLYQYYIKENIFKELLGK